MSVANLLKDIFTGNFSSAAARVKDWWEGVSPSVQAFLTKVETDEGKILTNLAETAVEDILSGGLTTTSFVAAAKDIGSKLVAQNIAMGQQDIFAALNIAVGAKTSPVEVPSMPPVSTEAPPASPEPAPVA
ncbi:MAG: hypothetical protein LAP61_05705 [Acidobacteriia bacterium]|nr:hypothetical protein [Terriglobia bacterium]